MLIGLLASGVAFANPETLLEISGRIHAQGLALEEARIKLQPLLDNYQQGRFQVSGTDPSDAAASIRPESTGEFRLPVERPGMYQLEVEAPGFLPLRYAPLPLVSSRRLPPAHLIPDLGLRVEALDSAGRPVEGVWVLAVPRIGTGALPFAANGWLVSPRYGRTDTTGVVVLARAAEEELELSARASGSFDQAETLATTSGATIRLPRPGPATTLEVVDSAGHPVVDALVMAGEPPWPTGLTDERGRLTGTGELSAPVPIQVFTRGGARLSTTLTFSGEGQPVRLRMQPRRTLRGKVLRADGGLPLGEALVWRGDDPGRQCWTGSDGRYEIQVPSVASFWIQAEADGFLPRVETVDRARIERGVVPTLALPARQIRTGRVVDAEGLPLAGARVSARPRQRPRAFRTDPVAGRALTAESGVFSLPLEADTTYELVAELDGYTPARQELVTSGRALRGPLVLHPTRAAFGRVLDPEEKPVVGARVRAHSSLRTREPWEARSDDRGRFSFPALPTSDLDLEVEGPEPLAPFRVRGLAIPPGDDAFDLGAVILAEGASITGRIFDSSGEKLAEAEIWHEESGDRDPLPTRPPRRPPDHTSDDKGRFRLTKLESGRRYDLWIRHPGHLPASFAAVLAPPKEPLELHLDAAARLSGRVLDDESRPLGGARVELEPAAPPAGVSDRVNHTRNRWTETDKDGSFEVTTLTPGRYRIFALAEGFIASSPQTVDVAAGPPREDLELILAPGHGLSGLVLGPDEEPVEGARIRTGEAYARSDAEGRYALLGLPLGESQLEARHPRLGVVRQGVEIEPGSNRKNIVFPPGWPIEGRVEDHEGEVVSGARIRLRPGDARAGSYRAESDLEGAFRIESAALGVYDLSIEHPDFASFRKRRAFQITDAPVEGLRLVLSPRVRLQGKVLGLEDGDLLRVQVTARRNGGGTHPARVQYDGHFEIEDLSPGDWWLEGRVPGGRRSVRQRVVITDDDRLVERDLEFTPGVSLTGEALLATEPLADAEVTLLDPSRGARRTVATDYAGEFEIADLEPGRYRLALSDPSQGVLHNEDLDLFADRHLVIDLHPASVAGVVRSALTGEPLAQSLVRLQQRLAADGPEGSVQTLGTDDEGRFRFQRLSEGTYRLDASRNGFVPDGLELQVGGSQDTADLELRLEPSSGLELELLLASGQPAQGVATVARLGPDGRIEAVESHGLDPRGRARFSHVPAGTWSLWVQAPGGADQRLTVESPGEVRTVSLSPAGTLTVRLPTLFSRPDLAARAVLDGGNGIYRTFRPTGAVVEGWPLEGGIARIPKVPAGRWTLRISAADGQTWTRDVRTPGGDQVLTLE